jgi:hypothetical protein
VNGVEECEVSSSSSFFGAYLCKLHYYIASSLSLSLCLVSHVIFPCITHTPSTSDDALELASIGEGMLDYLVLWKLAFLLCRPRDLRREEYGLRGGVEEPSRSLCEKAKSQYSVQ